MPPPLRQPYAISSRHASARRYSHYFRRRFDTLFSLLTIIAITHRTRRLLRCYDVDMLRAMLIVPEQECTLQHAAKKSEREA